jgi:hypothetical protein
MLTSARPNSLRNGPPCPFTKPPSRRICPYLWPCPYPADPASGVIPPPRVANPLWSVLSPGSHNFPPAIGKCEAESRILRQRIPLRCRNDAGPHPCRDHSVRRSRAVAVAVPHGEGSGVRGTAALPPSRKAPLQSAVPDRVITQPAYVKTCADGTRGHELPGDLPDQNTDQRIDQFAAGLKTSPRHTTDSSSFASSVTWRHPDIGCAPTRLRSTRPAERDCHRG